MVFSSKCNLFSSLAITEFYLKQKKIVVLLKAVRVGFKCIYWLKQIFPYSCVFFEQILGGWLAGRFGGKWVFGIGSLAVAIAALLIPIAARTNYVLVIILRVIQGLGQVSLAMAIAALLIPIAARTNYVLVIILRVIQGLGQVSLAITIAAQLIPMAARKSFSFSGSLSSFYGSFKNRSYHNNVHS